jgi:hypothetical protein
MLIKRILLIARNPKKWMNGGRAFTIQLEFL